MDNTNLRFRRSLPALTLTSLLAASTVALPLAGYASNADAGSAVTVQKKKKVLLIGIDGLRPDSLQQANTPNLDRLINQGFFSPMQAEDTTWSAPCWATVLYGVWRDRHGITNNSFTGSKLGNIPDLFSHVEQQNPALHTARVTSWDGIHMRMPTGADEDHYWYYGKYEDDTTVPKTIELLNNTDVDVLFQYFSMVDAKGHEHGFSIDVPEYRHAIEKADRQLGDIMNAMESRPGYANEDWLVVAVPDHGGTANGQHGENRPDHRNSWFIASGDAVSHLTDGIRTDAAPVDVVPSILDHLGLAWQNLGLDGRSVLRAQVAQPAQIGAELIVNGNAEHDRGYTKYGYEGSTSGWLEGGGAVPIQYGAPGGFPGAGSVPNGGKIFFAGGTKQKSAMTQRIDVAHLDLLQPTTYNLSAWLGGYAQDDDKASVTVRFNDDAGMAATKWDNGKVYFFRGNQYYRFDLGNDSVDSGYPAGISGGWSGLDRFTGGASDIDAVINWGNGKAYFFKDDEYIRYDIDADRADDGYPMKIAEQWPELAKFQGGARDIDAAINWSNGNAYFFKGAEYIRYNLSSGKVDVGYPMLISDTTWPGLQVWPSHIDAAFRKDLFKSYLFKEGEYVRFDHALNKADAGYPKRINSSSWSGLSDWYFGQRSVMIGPVTESDRGSATGFVYRDASGQVPTATQTIDVTVQFDDSWGSSDGYADNISLILQQ
ncbi:hemopexin repeat-containing protein [Kistimonas asteriae]|uniref:hemopexin repeat-containing protein n=1 Tax=Kistimonas asteriae TaxID=517724 RepID=UPI001BA985A3|nr:hemopexin repeat-containing protein [Kistimonas asteriae]